MSRDPGLIRAIALVDYVSNLEDSIESAQVVRERLRRLQSSLGEFVDSETFDAFVHQFLDAESQVAFRFQSLLFRGPSQIGKSQRAMAHWGMHRSLVLNCQGLDTALPNLQEFSKKDFDCIVYDEISERQVLANKVVFQSGPKLVTLGQSPCGPFRYQRDLYAVPMILCSNDFKLTVDDGLEPAQAQWLAKNVMVADLPPGTKTWFQQ